MNNIYTRMFDSDLKEGLSGLIRTRNEAPLLEPCIDSCIDALDELIVVCFDCTDNTLEILERKKKQYPTKLRVFEYNKKVLSFDLTKEEFEYAKALPGDSPRLYCNLCNWGMSKARYKYLTKIDADQLYFPDELKKWRDVCSGDTQIKWQLSFILGWFFMMYFSVYRRMSARCGKPCLWMIPDWLVKTMFKPYQRYSMWRLKHGTACIALSGLNVFKDDKWYVPFDGVNIHPPYNGEGDTVIFKRSEDTYWTRRYADKVTYSVTESFNCPYKMMFTRPVWFHLHANRVQCWSKVKKTKNEHPEWFVTFDDFFRMSYKDVHNKLNWKSHTLYQRTIFALIHILGKDVLKKHLNILDNVNTH